MTKPKRDSSERIRVLIDKLGAKEFAWVHDPTRPTAVKSKDPLNLIATNMDSLFEDDVERYAKGADRFIEKAWGSKEKFNQAKEYFANPTIIDESDADDLSHGNMTHNVKIVED